MLLREPSGAGKKFRKYFGGLFQQRVDEIRPHGIGGLKSKIKLEIIGFFLGFVHQFNGDNSPTALPHVLGKRGGLLMDQGSKGRQLFLQPRHGAGPQKMHLTHFGCREDFGFETATLSPEGGTFGGRGYHRTFFDDHGDGVGPVVDDKIGGQPVGHVKVRDGVLDELVVEFLNSRFVVPIARKHPVSVLGIGKKAVAKPFNFGFFGEFRKAGYRRVVLGHKQAQR